MARDLLFEIGVEEIPARFMAGSISGLVSATKKSLNEARLDFKDVRGMGTPRRLTLFVDGLAEAQKDLKEEIKGPAKKAAFDEDGNPTKALQGFLRSKGLKESDIVIREMKGGEYVFATKEEKGKAAMEILPDILVSAGAIMNCVLSVPFIGLSLCSVRRSCPCGLLTSKAAMFPAVIVFTAAAM